MNVLKICMISMLLFSQKPLEQNFQYSIIMFEGSDWCASCKEFKKNILEDSMVVDFMDKNHIQVVYVDFPQRKILGADQIKINETYAIKYNFKGIFPSVVFTSEEDDAYYTMEPLQNNPATFIKWCSDKIVSEK